MYQVKLIPFSPQHHSGENPILFLEPAPFITPFHHVFREILAPVSPGPGPCRRAGRVGPFSEPCQVEPEAHQGPVMGNSAKVLVNLVSTCAAGSERARGML